MYPDAYLAYLVHFHGDRDYFECHEILEEYWKSLPKEQRHSVWVGLIQIAVGLYHHRRGNFPGAEKMISSSLRITKQNPDCITALGLDVNLLKEALAVRLRSIQQGEAYQSINLPIKDETLLRELQTNCKEMGLLYGNPSNLNDSYLCNKHTLRDRSEVILERQRSLQAKQGS